MTRPSGLTSVMASRRSPPKGLDFFPTPPWATRALIEYILTPALGGHARPFDLMGWDPCCGEGHMAETAAESLLSCDASDIFDYGRGYRVEDALAPGCFDRAGDLLFMNPPFNIALDLVLAALRSAWAASRFGVFVLVRSAWLEGVERYRSLFSQFPPSINAPFVERVPMVAGRYDPKASSATAYSWIGWTQSRGELGDEPITFIPPCRKRLETAADIRRWCAPADAPLFDAAPA